MGAATGLIQDEWQGEGKDDKDSAVVYLTTSLRVRFTDPERKPMKGGRCRMAAEPEVVYECDGNGIAEIPLQDRSRKIFDLEWGSGAGTDPFPWINAFEADIRTGQDVDCGKRLTHLGFLGENLSGQVKEYQRFLGLPETGNLSEIHDGLVYWHDGGDPPGLAGAKATGTSAGGSGEVKALVEKLYEAFDDSGFLGTGGTDEEGVLGVLRSAKDKGLMREVDALYHKTYPDEPNLKDELDDELSGDEFDAAMKLYDEGMSGQAKATPAKSQATGTSAKKPANPVQGTVVPNGSIVEICLLDFDRMPMPMARCRLADAVDRVFRADQDGVVTLPAPMGKEIIEIEWRPDRLEEIDDDEGFFLQQSFRVDFAGEDDQSVANRLANLGFEGDSLDERLANYQKRFSGAEAGDFVAVRAELSEWILAQKSPVKESEPATEASAAV